MSDSKAQQEPSMEEILASIRRIISEDSSESRPDGSASVEDETPRAAAAPVADDDVLELTEVVEEAEPEPEPEPEPQAEPMPDPSEEDQPATAMEAEEEPLPPTDEDEAGDDRLVSDITVAASSAALARMMDRPSVPEPEPRTPLTLGDGTRTIEDIVRELLRPMLREWLDQNLPSIVEEIVEREIQKIGRSASRR